MRSKRRLHDAIETAAAHIARAFNDLHFATLAVDLPAAELRNRMALAVAELDQAARRLTRGRGARR